MTALAAAAWPAERLGEAVEALARLSGLQPHGAASGRPPEDPGLLGPWVEATAANLGVEALDVQCGLGDLDALVRDAAPAVLRTGDGRFLVLLRSGRRATLLGPDLGRLTVENGAVRRAIIEKWAAPEEEGLRDALARMGLPERRLVRVVDALMRERFSTVQFAAGWVVRLPASAPFARQVVQADLHRSFAAVVLLHAAAYALFLGSWYVVARGALSGRFDAGWLAGWALALLTLVPLRMASSVLQGRLGVGVGALLKRRLLLGALEQDPDEVRAAGAGALLGRVVESEAVETGALQGGMQAVVALVELSFAALVLWAGAGGVVHAGALLAWVAVAGGLLATYARRRRAWTAHRVAMTNDMIERMVGHRTRLAQEAPERWHDEEDDAVARHVALSIDLDRATAPLRALLSRGWALLGVALLVPAFVAGAGPGPLAIAVGGVLLAEQALTNLAGALTLVVGAGIGWEAVAPLFHAAGRAAPDVPPVGLRPADPTIQARDLVFRYDPRRPAVVQGASLSIRPGERVLLEGASGGGKSTFVALLAGLRAPESGLLLLDGADRHTLGEDGWRRRVAAAPQFHLNHVLCETFAFNALMGRGWPSNAQWNAELEALCEELGLGPLLQRMPAGTMQMVGESGWQLSHGERSRLYVLRALLQGAELVILDESFAALDPENLRRALECVLKRAPALVVVAHP